jgi:hypothetical protein
MAAIVNPKAKLKFIDRTVVLCIDGVVRDRAVVFSREDEPHLRLERILD